jgi:hypothetical protein
LPVTPITEAMLMMRPLRAFIMPRITALLAVDAGEVGVEDGLPVLVLHPHQQLVAGDAGVVDEDRDRAEFLARPLDQGVSTAAGIGHVEHAPAAKRAEALADRLRAGLAGRGADDGRALRGQFIGDRRADAAAGAGDQRDFALAGYWLIRSC